jgi:hypothetical protein
MVALSPLWSVAAELEAQSSPDTSLASEENLLLMLQSTGCDFRFESGDGYRRITDQEGRQYTLFFNANNRLAEFDIPGGKGVVVYRSEGGGPVGVINKGTGQAFSLAKGPGPEWYRSMRAQWKLPTVEKIVGQICGNNPRSKYLSQDGEEIPDGWDLYLMDDYWIFTGFQALDDYWGAKPPPPPQCDFEDCTNTCTDRDIFALLGCVVVAGSFAIVGAPLSGAIAGGVCAFIFHGAVYPECQRRCQVRCNR